MTRAPDDVTHDPVTVPVDKLASWLAPRLDLDGPVRARRVSTGHSNEMFRVTSGQRTWLLRRPPRVDNAPGAHNMAREYRLLSALHGSGIPHPEALALCESPDVIGTPFLLLEYVEGFAPRLPLPRPFHNDPQAQREMCFDMVAALARLAAFDWQGAGLDGFGRPVGFLERQVDRWLGQLAKYRTRELPWVDELADWLQQRVPVSAPTGLIHGDYTWSNVMFAPDRPGRVAAIVDWEQATIGCPLLDIGYLLGLWYEPGEEATGRDPATLFCQLPGNPTRNELLEHYATHSGLAVDDIGFYQVLALFKLSCIIEGSYARHISGRSDDPVHASFKQRVPALLLRAATFAGLT